MRLSDFGEETYAALTANRVRSGLTILGIIIGIASVIALVAIGQGAQGSIQASIAGLGSNLLSVTPGAQQQGRGFVSTGRGASQTLKNGDVEVIRGIGGVASVSPEFQRRFQMTSPLGNNTNSTVIGATESYAAVRNVAIASGVFLSEAHERSLARVAVIGPTVATDLFGEVDPVGRTIRMQQVDFRVIGVLQAKGGSGFFSPDETVLIPLATMQRILTGADYLTSIAISVASEEQMSVVQEEATLLLTTRHRVAEPDFSIVSQADILGALTQVTTTFTIFLASIAGISLVVGGIGIMNMMLTAVTERTREIGLRKALGARRRDISAQFLAEAVLLTCIGGGCGVALGWGLARLVTQFTGIATAVSLQSIALAFGVSAAIGIAFGYYPARRAAKLNPIVALRYE